MVYSSRILATLGGRKQKEMNIDEAVKVHRSLKVLMMFLGVNLVVQGIMIIYYRIFKELSTLKSIEESSDSYLWHETQLVACIVWAGVAIFTGIMGIVAGICSSTTAAMFNMFGWIFMAVAQVIQTFIVLSYAHKIYPDRVNEKTESLLIFETVGLFLMEMVFILFVKDFINVNKWHEEVFTAGEARMPLILEEGDLNEEEGDEQVYHAYQTVSVGQQIRHV